MASAEMQLSGTVQISKPRHCSATQHPHFWEREDFHLLHPSSHPAVSLALSPGGKP